MEKLLSNLYALPSGSKVLDIGCGAGLLVQKLRAAGFEAYGADFAEILPDPCPPYLLPIEAVTSNSQAHSYKVVSTYRLPFDDGTFASVVSTSVLEHVLDKEPFFQEIRRVLAPGGILVSSFPGSKYLPRETHTCVPLLNFLLPYCGWWIALWAILGVRNPFQKGQSWRAVYNRNLFYCKNNLNYWPVRKYRKYLQKAGFSNFRCGIVDDLPHMEGGYAALMRKLRVPKPIRRALCDLRDVHISAVKA